MDWWCQNQPVVNLAEKQVAVTLGGKVATLPLVRSPELVSDLQQLNIVDNVNFILSCKKEVVESQKMVLLLPCCPSLPPFSTPLLLLKSPKICFLKLILSLTQTSILEARSTCWTSWNWSTCKGYINSKLKEEVIVPSKLSLVSPVILVPKSSGKLCV